MKLSKKQAQLLTLITSENEPKIYVEGSVQSGKTYVIALSVILYCQELYKKYPDEKFNAAIIGWTVGTVKRNIVQPMQEFLETMGIKTEVKGGADNPHFDLWNTKVFFFGFQNAISFNRILGSPLIFEWVDEAARIYSQGQLRESFDQLPGRQVAYSGHPYLKRIHSFNVEGGANHPYKARFLENCDGRFLIFYPYDNPVLDTPEKVKETVEAFPPGSLRDQKIYNKWVVSEGKVFTDVKTIESLQGLTIREIGIGIDYGSVNATVFVPIALATDTKGWRLIRLETYYHDPHEIGDNPTTEFFSQQLKLFLIYLKKRYPGVPITTIVVDSEAKHFENRLQADGIPFLEAQKPAGSVVDGVQQLQSLFYKGFLKLYRKNSVQAIYQDLSYDEMDTDRSFDEFDSYQYDRTKSEASGGTVYLKTNDHTIDATRYIISEFERTGRCPTV